jgi:hypothetical protein
MIALQCMGFGPYSGHIVPISNNTPQTDTNTHTGKYHVWNTSEHSYVPGGCGHRAQLIKLSPQYYVHLNECRSNFWVTLRTASTHTCIYGFSIDMSETENV